MRSLAGDAVDPAALLLRRADLVSELLADEAGERAAHAVRLPAGGRLQLGKRRAFRAAQQRQQRLLRRAALAG